MPLLTISPLLADSALSCDVLQCWPFTFIICYVRFHEVKKVPTGTRLRC